MTVKMIFRTIIGTIAIIVIGSLTMELFNMNTTSLQLSSMTKMATRQACVFFGQETYKREDAETVNMSPIYASNGGVAHTGRFYTGSTAKDIYHNLYETGEFLSTSGPVMQQFKGNWESLDLLIEASDTWGIGEFYRESMMTPLNLGIPYLDREVVEKIMRWNLTSILNNGQTEDGRFLNLHQDNEGYYVLYKGFRVYAPTAEVTDIEYEILDLRNASDADKFKTYTNMDASVITDKTDGSSDERNKVCLAGISYRVKMKYEGITPIKRAAEFGWNKRVEGANGGVSGDNVGTQVWDDTGIGIMEQGGFTGSNERGVLPVPGKLIYYIIR